VDNLKLSETTGFGESLFSRLINKGMETFKIMSDREDAIYQQEL